MKNLIKNEQIKFNFNPFGGLDDDENNFVLQPEIDFKEVEELLKDNSAITIELVGRKGRGKTSHLRALSNYIKDCEFIQLSTTNKAFSTNTKKSIYIIDSIHHLKLTNRLSLWRQKNNSFIISTHISKKLEFISTGRKFKSYKIGQNSKEDLKLLIQKRIALASNINNFHDIDLNNTFLENLSAKHKSDKRAILTNLYSSFKQK
ncbi:hypothetical protein [Pseudofulvibacter geojedonensis]|uniref:Chromosomal replication initiator protein DnaA domain-containing protein n=1 Tax=Pseudofulvibacter geojedonensis TaxID=1123758 RepID=A0ABW3HZ60_9FLAO